ncbi:hypothetical protein [Leptospira interrogans]|uniref:hypothetical protein n=1 Tax=Leptospira interrogans TaxID=173 RepID=UPI00030D0A2D
MFYGDFVSNFFSLDSILFALFDILTLFQGRLINVSSAMIHFSEKGWNLNFTDRFFKCRNYHNL